jgi:signal transduction histidine kinase
MAMLAKFKTSIQGQLFLALASFTVLLCIGYTGVAVLVAYVTEDMVLESILTHEAKILSEQQARTGTWQQPGASYMQLVPSFAAMPAHLTETVQAANLRGAKKSEVFSKLHTHYHVLRLTPSTDGAYLVAEVSSFLVVSSLSKNIASFMLGVAHFMILAAVLLAYWLTRRIAAPLVQLSQEVARAPVQADTHQMAPHFTASQRADEIGFLARTLHASLQSLQTALQRETLLTRDISHELRTPVTIIQNVLNQETSAGITAAEHLLLKTSMQEIENTINTLLALARAENMQSQDVDLLARIEQAILNLEKIAKTHARTFTVELHESCYDQRYLVKANMHLLDLLFNNLFNNALFHGGDNVHIKINLDTHHIIIGNTINSSSSSTLHGFSHGKNLLSRIVNTLQWDIGFQHTPIYFEVVITLMPQDTVKKLEKFT